MRPACCPAGSHSLRLIARTTAAPLAAPTLLVALALLAPLAGCAPRGTTSPPSEQPAPSAAPTSPTEPTSSAEPTPATGVALSHLALELEPIARGLDAPLWLTHAGDGSGRLFVAEQTGRIRVIRDGELQPAPFLNIGRRISSGGERGLLGVAFSPDYESSGRLYVNYTDTDGDTVIERFTADDPSSDTPRFAAQEIVFTVKQPFANHNGGCIVFGPDGLLWVGMGDGGSAGDPNGNAQNPRALLGKMLVVDVSGEGPAKPGVRYRGLRNPWRFSFDRATDDLWIADVGQNAIEEIDFVPAKDATKPLNFGWNRWEGSEPYATGGTSSRRGFTFPIVEYRHDEGRSITGGYVYRGTSSPAMAGTYLYADFASGWVAGARRDSIGKVSTRRLLERAGSPSSFGEDEAGEVYLVDLGGTVSRIVGRER